MPTRSGHKRETSNSVISDALCDAEDVAAAERCTNGLNSMSSTFYNLAKATIDDLIDWQCWHGPPPMMPSAVHAMHSLLGSLDE